MENSDVLINDTAVTRNSTSITRKLQWRLGCSDFNSGEKWDVLDKLFK